MYTKMTNPIASECVNFNNEPSAPPLATCVVVSPFQIASLADDSIYTSTYDSNLVEEDDADFIARQQSQQLDQNLMRAHEDGKKIVHRDGSAVTSSNITGTNISSAIERNIAAANRNDRVNFKIVSSEYGGEDPRQYSTYANNNTSSASTGYVMPEYKSVYDSPSSSSNNSSTGYKCQEYKSIYDK